MNTRSLVRWLLRKQEYFMYRGAKLPYFCKDIRQIDTERVVEIPIVYECYKKYKPEEILEVGNVLWHQGIRGHDVVDIGVNEYDRNCSSQLFNEDIATFTHPKGKKYRCIISISTIEHIGWDEFEYDPKKIFKAIDNMRDNLLAPGGKIIATIPLGYNDNMDAIHTTLRGFSTVTYMKRLSYDNHWTLGKGSLLYGFPFHCANTIAVLE